MFSYEGSQHKAHCPFLRTKIRLSEQKTKFFLSFFKREYLRPQVKDTIKRAKNQIFFEFFQA